MHKNNKKYCTVIQNIFLSILYHILTVGSRSWFLIDFKNLREFRIFSGKFRPVTSNDIDNSYFCMLHMTFKDIS